MLYLRPLAKDLALLILPPSRTNIASLLAPSQLSLELITQVCTSNLSSYLSNTTITITHLTTTATITFTTLQPHVLFLLQPYQPTQILLANNPRPIALRAIWMFSTSWHLLEALPLLGGTRPINRLPIFSRLCIIPPIHPVYTRFVSCHTLYHTLFPNLSYYITHSNIYLFATLQSNAHPPFQLTLYPHLTLTLTHRSPILLTRPTWLPPLIRK